MLCGVEAARKDCVPLLLSSHTVLSTLRSLVHGADIMALLLQALVDSKEEQALGRMLRQKFAETVSAVQQVQSAHLTCQMCCLQASAKQPWPEHCGIYILPCVCSLASAWRHSHVCATSLPFMSPAAAWSSL